MRRPNFDVRKTSQSFYDSVMPKLEIVVLTYRRANLLRRCLQSLELSAAKASSRVRTIVVVNGEDAETSAELVRLANELGSLEIEIVESDQRLPCGFARNAGVERCSGDWIYFADDDAWVSEDFMDTFGATIARDPGLVVIGGPNVTAPTMTDFQKIAGRVLGSRLAAGPFSRRYRSGGEITTVDDDHALILCNLFVKRSALADYRFPAELSCAEENHMLHFLDTQVPGEAKIFHPGLAVFHERAHDFTRFASSALRYGRGRGELIAIDGWSVASSRLVLMALIVASIAVVILPIAWLGSYFAVVALNGMAIALRAKSLRALALAPLLTLALHLLYPMGVVIGILQTPSKSLRTMSAPILALAEARSSRRARRRD
ncbi:MAG: glycosyltransferase family A protein [Bdellovibrionota bacterium]